jgi:hypothetical protein
LKRESSRDKEERCRAIGVPVQAYLAWAFDRLGTHRDLYGLDIADITPEAFKRATR